MSKIIKSRTVENRKYYDAHTDEIKKYANEYYMANKSDETIKLNRLRAKANYELKKEQIKERNLARYYTNLSYSDSSSSDEEINI